MSGVSRSKSVACGVVAVVLGAWILLAARVFPHGGIVANMDIGEIFRGSTVQRRFRIWNLRPWPVKAHSSKSSCSCVLGDLQGRFIWPLWNTIVDVSYSSPQNGHTGDSSGYLFLSLGSGDRGVSLPLRVRVRAGTKLTREVVEFDSLKAAQWEEERIGVVLENKSTRVARIDYDRGRLSVRVDGNTVLVRPIAPEEVLADHAYKVSILTENPVECIPFSVRVRGLDCVKIEPSCFFWEKGVSERSQEKFVVVRLLGEARRLEFVVPLPPSVDLKMAQEAGGEYRLTCRVGSHVPIPADGYFSEKIRVRLLPEDVVIPILAAGSFR